MGSELQAARQRGELFSRDRKIHGGRKDDAAASRTGRDADLGAHSGNLVQADSHRDADSNRHRNRDRNAHRDSDCNRHADRYSHRNANDHFDSDGHFHRDCNGDDHADSDRHALDDSDADNYSGRHHNHCADRHCDDQSGANRDTDRECNRHFEPCSDSASRDISITRFDRIAGSGPRMTVDSTA